MSFSDKQDFDSAEPSKITRSLAVELLTLQTELCGK